MGEERTRNLFKLTQKQTGLHGTWLVHSLLFCTHVQSNTYNLEEHHIGNFDPASFFTLHDYDDNGFWDSSEILKTYGMDDPSAKDVSQEQKDKIVREIMKMFDRNDNHIVEREEWMAVVGEGKGTLPDFGLGPGHHWDMEMEYEIHHWEK
jgi:hypothetical protein